ncbi:decaprenylphospho-beta-D-erythro-pentofuranosid-2-ulose 2-reductase [Gordonia crocea]|uniref:Putative oxidoreductase n=1 Tax=Gordonia crocea TaxID=589162 RepID=A0A7I9UYU0_9ACTN|nr:decaprenylphospho-beta-D-erythro-pentofuranosid-2-ulose 2-reductase [Gordonia crocea]GED97991.1 putative oxidoreductase [Gordonia crocea]
MTGSILLFGGRSEIGLAVAIRMAQGQHVVLAARRSDDLGDETAALLEAGATGVDCVEFDAEDTDAHPALIAELMAHGPVETAIVAFGILGDAAKAEADVEHALQIARVDYLAQVSIITLLANALRDQGSGTIIAFSSIAGQRVRRANYVYGSTKAGLDGFASGLSDALHGSGVRLLLVRSGFVIGAMTRELMESGVKPAPFSKTADQVADAVVRADRRGKTVVWVPWAIAPMTLVFRLLPRSIWRRMPR